MGDSQEARALIQLAEGALVNPQYSACRRRTTGGGRSCYFVNVIFTNYEIHQEIDVASYISFPAAFLYLLFTRNSTLCGTSCGASSQE